MKFNKLIPELCVSDLKKSLHFYVGVLEFKLEYQREEKKFAFVSYEGSQIMLEENLDSKWKTAKLEYPFGRGINFQIEVSDVGSLLERLEKSNYPIKIRPKENWYRKDKNLLGVKEFLVLDPDGYLLRFSQSLGRKSL
ncbi:TPA: VOC family protein [Candidatus Micrarchaeota archaeon]|nr:VOC family protein [Candidatus Micrarchaeota archaeon]HIH29919.1 VOC family protein [Candidatus Micrarchaeota archaeon]